MLYVMKAPINLASLGVEQGTDLSRANILQRLMLCFTAAWTKNDGAGAVPVEDNPASFFNRIRLRAMGDDLIDASGLDLYNFAQVVDGGQVSETPAVASNALQNLALRLPLSLLYTPGPMARIAGLLAGRSVDVPRLRCDTGDAVTAATNVFLQGAVNAGAFTGVPQLSVCEESMTEQEAQSVGKGAFGLTRHLMTKATPAFAAAGVRQPLAQLLIPGLVRRIMIRAIDSATGLRSDAVCNNLRLVANTATPFQELTWNSAKGFTFARYQTQAQARVGVAVLDLAPEGDTIGLINAGSRAITEFTLEADILAASNYSIFVEYYTGALA